MAQKQIAVFAKVDNSFEEVASFCGRTPTFVEEDLMLAGINKILVGINASFAGVRETFFEECVGSTGTDWTFADLNRNLAH